MKNKQTTTTSKYSKTGNIYKTPNGTFRARIYTNGKNVSKNFPRKKDAKQFLKTVTN